MTTIQKSGPNLNSPSVHQQLEAILRALVTLQQILIRFGKLIDEALHVYLNARFSGRGSDRWSRRG